MDSKTGQTGWTETVLHDFNGSDGAAPLAGLALGANGALYGTTSRGGLADDGTVFALSPPPNGGTRWGFDVLHSFMGPPDGSYPYAAVTLDSSGDIFGAAELGGRAGCDGGCGGLFKLAPSSSSKIGFTYTFDAGLTRYVQNPYTRILIGQNNELFGTAGGGRNGDGVVYGLPQ
jgi:uncharacterized repeat protein (TIGR03803 family)